MTSRQSIFQNFVTEVSGWMKEGRIQYREHILDGLEKRLMPSSDAKRRECGQSADSVS